LPGSGKTTFAEALVKHTTSDSTQPNGQAGRPWLRASQDDAPSKRRQECEARVRNGLKQGYNVIVDRVGFDSVYVDSPDKKGVDAEHEFLGKEVIS
jgi:thymidylate kinase